jgi:hypothetical protein
VDVKVKIVINIISCVYYTSLLHCVTPNIIHPRDLFKVSRYLTQACFLCLCRFIEIPQPEYLKINTDVSYSCTRCSFSVGQLKRLRLRKTAM